MQINIRGEISRRSATYSKSTLPSQVRCANPRCQQGGLATQQIVNFHPDGQYDFLCNERGLRPC